MQVRITSHRDPEPLDLTAFESLAKYVLELEGIPEMTELSLAVVGVDEMTELNEQYRDSDGPTDVLSFGCDDPCPVDSDELVTLGDVVIAPEIAEKQAAELGTTIEEELNLLLVHGILHLLGYTHDDDAAAAAMQARERALLESYTDSL